MTESTVYDEDYARVQEEYTENEALKEKEKVTIMLHEAKAKKDAVNTQSPEGTIVSDENCNNLYLPIPNILHLWHLLLAEHENDRGTIEEPATFTPDSQPQPSSSSSANQIQGVCIVCYETTLISHFHLIEEPELDEDTETWPVPKELVKEFNKVKANYRVLPLVVYDIEDRFVEAAQVNNALKNALVEIHFGISHYKIGRMGETHDSFTAVPKQIIILKTAPIQSPSAYKRKNIRSGPVRPKGFEDFRKGDSSKGKNVASGSRA